MALDGLWFDWGKKRAEYVGDSGELAWLLMRVGKIERGLEVVKEYCANAKKSHESRDYVKTPSREECMREVGLIDGMED